MRIFNIAIRADGSTQTGMGHLMRCLSIALALKEKNASVLFITNNSQSETFLVEKGFPCVLLSGEYRSMEEEVEDTIKLIKKYCIPVLLVDSYEADENYLEQLSAAVSVFYMDDLGRMELPVKGIINYNIYGQNMGYQEKYTSETRLILGSKYAPVKAAFKNTPYTIREKVSNILITMGGSDALNIAGQLGALLLEHLPAEVTLTLVCGRFSPHLESVRLLAETEVGKGRVEVLTDVSDMWNVMQKCDLAIAAAGSTMYELCTMGVPTICCYYVDNQRRMAECFDDKTSMRNAGDFSKEPEAVLQIILSHTLALMQEETLRKELSLEMQNVTDGMGACRIADALQEFMALK